MGQIILVFVLLIVVLVVVLLFRFLPKEETSPYIPIGYFPITRLHPFTSWTASTSEKDYDGYIVDGDNILYFDGAVVFEGTPQKQCATPNLYLKDPNNLVFEGGVFLATNYSLLRPYWKDGYFLPP